MPSITSWTRLEPRSRSEDMCTGLQARVHDPLWMLARQWQLGEFKGEDAGSPVVARLRAQCARLSRYHPGLLIDDGPAIGQPYDGNSLPLEAFVEREPVHRETDAQAGRRLAAEAGLHFLRLLGANGAAEYRDAYLAQYPFEPPSQAEQQTLDDDSLRFLSVITRRVPDGIRLYDDLKALARRPDGALSELPGEPPVATRDRDAVLAAASRWLEWYETLFSQPATVEPSWIPERMEYGFAVSARTTAGELVLEAQEYSGGHLDWYSFNARPGASLGAGAGDGEPEDIVRTVIPAPVRYRGMPVSRWWEFEDAQIDFGSVEAGPEDLARMLFVEFALVYGHDWFVVPIELGVGSACRIRSMVVTDTFGERTLIRPYTQVDEADSRWRMFCLDRTHVSPADADGAEPADDTFFLPPVLPASVGSSLVEEVLFLRDEIANMAWAVERIVESPIGRPTNRFEASHEQHRRQTGEPDPQQASSPAPLVYRLATSVPEHWVPLVPVRQEGDRSIRLARGRMAGGTDEGAGAKGRILEPGRPLGLFEEEIPRSGARVTRAYQYARWISGSTHLWLGRRKRPGRGEGWSGLRFDIVETA